MIPSANGIVKMRKRQFVPSGVVRYTGIGTSSSPSAVGGYRQVCLGQDFVGTMPTTPCSVEQFSRLGKRVCISHLRMLAGSKRVSHDNRLKTLHHST